MRMRRDDSILLLIDIQEKLYPTISDGETLLAHCQWLADLAARLAVPTILTEQYPAGLGPTLPALRDRCPAAPVIEKMHFSAVVGGNLLPACGSRRQFVVAGTEAHVCVLQTVLDLIAPEREVFVVAEAVGSRRPEDRALAIERMRQAGAVIVSREMVAFEWLDRAGTDTFRTISREMIR
ncbi:MAG TPA: hydrolase [Rhodocyclaceae bacterium]